MNMRRRKTALFAVFILCILLESLIDKPFSVRYYGHTQKKEVFPGMNPAYRQVSKITKTYLPEQGCTCPAVVLLENGEKAILKYPGNPQGIIILFNEYITSQIAQKIGLSIPQFGFAYVGESVAVDDEVQVKNVSAFQGIGFYCHFIPQANKVSLRAVKHVCNLDETSRIILLDELVRNCDRHSNNALLTITSPSTLYAIDHSHALGDPSWDITSLPLTDEHSSAVWTENHDFYEMLIRAGAKVTPETLAAEQQRIQALITPEFLDEVLATLPQAWVESIGSENILHAKQYVLYRVQHLDSICKMIIEERSV